MTQVNIPLTSIYPEKVLPMPAPADVAISLKSLSLSFGSLPVLNGLDLEAPRGSIFGLLGPSGCGKTSLIRCILGTLKHTSGSVTVFGQPPGSSHCSVPGAGVGYMPQEITLYDDLTIRETLAYFGSLYAMSREQVKERTSFLVNFLNLPDSNRLVRNLSGGQKRRVSLATALIHKPPLLLLDEPTVGVDPLLRHSIWAHLIELSQRDQVTVLITTHYIEEARDATHVGLMRDGRMLAQNTPAELMRRYERSSLEAVFLYLCSQAENQPECADLSKEVPEVIAEDVPEVKSQHSRRDSTSSSTSSGVVSLQEENQRAVNVPDVEAANNTVASHIEPVHWRTQMAALMGKNINAIWRNHWLMLFNFFLPTVELVIFCACIGLNLRFIDLAIYDGDQSVLSQSILSAMSPVIRQHHYASPAEAIAAVENGLASGALSFSPNFLSCLQERLMLMGEIGSDMLYNSTIHLYPDMANQLNVITIQKEVLGALVTAGKAYLGDVGASPNLLDIPLHMEKPVYGNEDPQFTEFMAPGVILSIAFLAAVPLTTINLVTERRQGLMERNVVAGVPHLLLLLSHLLSQALILAVQVALLMLTVFPVFQITFYGEVFQIVLLTLLQSLCGLSFGLFVASVSTSENMATMLSLGIFYPMLLLSGTVWPIDAMHPIIRTFSLFLPQTIPITSMRHMMSRGWSVAHWQVLNGFLVSGGWILLFVLLATFIYRYRKF